jgi:hypothetical protein
MHLAELLLAVRKAAGGHPRPDTAQLAVTTLIAIAVIPGLEGQVVRGVLRGFLYDPGNQYSAADFESLRPLALGALERLLEALLDGTYTDTELVKSLEPLFAKPTH